MNSDVKERELNIAALTENLQQVLDFVDASLEEAECPVKTQMQIDVAVEEIFINIASYAYSPGKGDATVTMYVKDGVANITFCDSGTPYDPLAKEDPDVTLGADERPIGGRGIFMVKRSMDDITYEYKDGSNILKIKKNLR